MNKILKSEGMRERTQNWSTGVAEGTHKIQRWEPGPQLYKRLRI